MKLSSSATTLSNSRRNQPILFFNILNDQNVCFEQCESLICSLEEYLGFHESCTRIA